MAKVILDQQFNNVQEQVNRYSNAWENYADELMLLDMKIQLQIMIQAEKNKNLPEEPYIGLVMSEQEAYRLLYDNSHIWQSDELYKLNESINLKEAYIEQRLQLTLEQNIYIPISFLAEAFHLSSIEQNIILICMAVELNNKYEKLYGYLQDDMTYKYPSIEVIKKLVCHSEAEAIQLKMILGAEGKLFKYKLIKVINREDSISFQSTQLRLEERIVSFLHNTNKLNKELLAFTEISYPSHKLPPFILDQQIQEKLRAFVSYELQRESGDTLIFNLWGRSGSGKKNQVKHLCQYINVPVILIDLEKMIYFEQSIEELLQLVYREVRLYQSVVCFTNFQVLLNENEGIRKKLDQLLHSLNNSPQLVFLLSDIQWKPAGMLENNVFIDMEIPSPNDLQRKLIWESLSVDYDFDESLNWGLIASKFRLTTGQIKNAIEVSKNLAHWQDGKDAKIGVEQVYAACYIQVQHRLEKKAKKLNPKFNWEDIILPNEQKEQLINASNQVKYRHVVYGQWGFDRKLSYGKGLSMLFSGPPGTGKTMAAEVVAKELHLEIFKIDLSQIISKYIGETEKNLNEIFKEAQLSNAILFFDETDALFGKRSEVKDSHDKYANIETAYLLQKMEEYDGISVLATNYLQNIDEAFMRRINYIIKFPFPDQEYREKLWRHIFPKETPLHDDIDYTFLAEKFHLAGGNIKNIAVSSAFLAAEKGEKVCMKHIIQAAKHEINKSGKILLKEELGIYKEY